MSKTLERKLETNTNPLEVLLTDKSFGIDVSTWQSASQLIAQMLVNQELRSMAFWTSDSSLAHLVGDDVEYVLGSLDTNLIARNPQEALRQLNECFNYFPTPSEIDFVLSSPNTFRVRASELGGNLMIYDYSKESASINVLVNHLALGKQRFTELYGEKISALFDQVLGESIYGLSGLAAELLKNLSTYFSIVLLKPDYVRAQLKDKKEGAIVRACALKYASGFDTQARDIYLRNIFVRAVSLYDPAKPIVHPPQSPTERYITIILPS